MNIKGVKQGNLIIVVILSSGLAIRILFSIFIPYQPLFDDAVYDDMGVLIASGKFSEIGLAFASGYPIFLGAIYYCFGHNIIYIQIIQSVLSVASCWMCYLITRKLENKIVAIIAIVLMAFNPTFIRYSQLIFGETLFIFTLLLVFYLLFREREIPSFFRQASIGLLLGYASLIRTYFLFFPIIVGLWLVYTNSKKLSAIKQAVVVLVFTGAALLPILYLNYQTYDRLVLTTGSGINLWVGNNPDADGTLAPLSAIIEADTGNVTDLDKDRFYTQKALSFIMNNPLDFLLVYLRKITLLWTPDFRLFSHGTTMFEKLYGILKIFYYSFVVILPAFLSLFIVDIKRHEYLMLYLMVIYTTLITCLFVVIYRYRIPILPFLLIFSATTYHYIFETIQKKCQKA